ncbi:unnamed protein product [Chondrus crispus]|uniref:Uncharacterized protein n=1 Tax=Chondrus crispus TaxID=2769 RepID=R7QFT2_CHOCR|nr:unnamed protein product [Chondrus crispus]CDF36613.1 unnamed protein product [Chondrus crispus]|eukprot:XP_005716432.1 unnamed protein product [Chondrus crispus]
MVRRMFPRQIAAHRRDGMSEEERSRKREGLEMCSKGDGAGAHGVMERKAWTYRRGNVLRVAEQRMGEDGWEEQ